MTAAPTYTPIASYTATGNITSYTFSSITGTYTDLVMVASIRCDVATYNNMNFTTVTLNGSTSSIYGLTALYTRNTGSETINSYSSGLQAGFNFGGSITTGSTSTIFSNYILNLNNYSNSTTYKTVLNQIASPSNLTTSDGVAMGVGVWRSTAAITSITFTPSNSANYVAGSTFSLYGILAA